VRGSGGAPPARGGGIAGIAELDRPSILGMGSACGGGGDELDNLYLLINVMSPTFYLYRKEWIHIFCYRHCCCWSHYK